MHKAIRQYMHMVKVICCILELYGLLIEHCISLCLGGICQVLFRTGQAQLCQDDFHISSRDVTA